MADAFNRLTARLEQTLSNLQMSGDMKVNKSALAEITTLLEDIQRIINTIEHYSEPGAHKAAGRFFNG